MTTKKTPHRKTRIKIFALVVVFVLVVAAVYYFNPAAQLPKRLIGLWTTSHPKYKDRYFKIETKKIIVGTGGFNVDVYVIRDIEAPVSNEDGLYVIDCQNSHNDSFRFAFNSMAGEPDEIRFQHQKQIVWNKEKVEPSGP